MFSSCNDKSSAEFSLTGKTRGIENGTMIYLDNADSQTIDLIDSTKVENNSFVFNTELPNSPLHVVLRTNDDSHYRFLWLENKSMTFDASQNDFENAIVTGSKVENSAQSLRKELENLSEENQRKKEIEFIKKHPNSIVSAETLSTYLTTFGKNETKELFDLFSDENKLSKYGKIISSYLELKEQAEIGGQFIDFEMVDKNGELKKLSDLKGKIIFLDFWASWCAPCRKENPNLVKTYEKFKPKGFEIFAVSLDENKENWIKAIEKDKLNWYHVNDLKGNGNKASLIYGVEGIPDSFLIDQNGIIVARDLRGKELDKKLTELME
ncbi:TlpA disulfide reductase family protein [Winogradskyella algicola]|uniref:TlpA disulfide reductase family protein n=1 Tax=Winogradskyella algicola TaxID=2575815 RepID=UPI0021D0BE2C|nr:TlpA disulfide reductase family protein [Winogradskyella algicola]